MEACLSPSPVTSVTMNNSHTSLAVSGKKGYLRDIASGRETSFDDGCYNHVWYGDTVITANHGGSLSFYTIDGKTASSIKTKAPVISLSVHPSEKILATVSEGNTWSLYDLATCSLIDTWQAESRKCWLLRAMITFKV